MATKQEHQKRVENERAKAATPNEFMKGLKEVPETDEQASRLAERDRKAGKSPSTQAGHFVHEEIEHAKKGVHTVRSAKQAVAIGLSKARKYGIPLKRKTSPSKKAA